MNIIVFQMCFKCDVIATNYSLPNSNFDMKSSSNIVKVSLNLSLLRCMLFANNSRNFYPIVMKFGKHYFLVLRQLPRKFQEKILCSLKVRPFDM